MHDSSNINEQKILVALPIFQLKRQMLMLIVLLLAVVLRSPVKAQVVSPGQAAKTKIQSEEMAKHLFPTQQDAMKFALKLYKTPVSKEWPGLRWYDYLPPCPDKLSNVDKDEWVLDSEVELIRYYHPNGATSFRSKRRYCVPYDVHENLAPNNIGTKSLPKWHGQQACYRNNRLIINPADSGAGTPDFVGGDFVTSLNLDAGLPGRAVDLYRGWLKSSHFYYDVATWEVLGYETYNQFWRPQGGETTAFNVLVGRTKDGVSPFADGNHPAIGGSGLESKGWRDTMLDVKPGDVLRFDARGKVVWGGLGESCDADGDPNTTKKLFREIFAPRPFSDERIGTLMGAIFTNSKLPSNEDVPNFGFKVGTHLTYIVPKYGRLWLGINDADTDNNKGYFDVQVHKLSAGQSSQ